MVLLKLFFIISISIVMKIISYRILDGKRNYEFENRDSGGNVLFKDYKSSKKHNRVKYWAGALNAFAISVFLLAVLYFFVNIDGVLEYF